MHAPTSVRERTLLNGLERAEGLRDEGAGRDVVLLIDAPPTGDLSLEVVRRQIGMRSKGSITLLVFELLLPNTGYARAAVDDTGWDAQIVFDRQLAKDGTYPAVDAPGSWSRLLEDGRTSAEHVAIAREVRDLLASDSGTRAQRAVQFQSQPFFVAEPWTARPGAFVPIVRQYKRADTTAKFE